MSSTIKALLITAAVAGGQAVQAAGFAPWSESRPVTTEKSTMQVRVTQIGFAPWRVHTRAESTATLTVAPTLAVYAGSVGFAPWTKPNA